IPIKLASASAQRCVSGSTMSSTSTTSPAITNSTSGNCSLSEARTCAAAFNSGMWRTLVLHQIEVIGLDRCLVVKNLDKQRQADRRLRGGDIDHEEEDDHPLRLAHALRERDKRQVGRVEHQL